MAQSRSRIAKSAVAAGLLLGATGTALVFAPWADAHHSDGAIADFVCAPDGGYLVTWSVSAWSPDSNGNHPAVQANYLLDGAAPVVVPDDDAPFPASDAAGTPIQGLGEFTDADKDFGGVLYVPYSGADRTIQIVPRTLTVAPQDLYYPDGDDAGTELDVIPAGTELFWNIWTKVDPEGDLPSTVEVLPAESCVATTTTTPEETTSTTAPEETTSTTAPEETTTTTAPEETTSTTAPEETTTTTDPEVSSSSSTPSTAPTEVAGARQTRTPGQLPTTGSESTPLATLGLALLGAGVTVVVLADRRRRTSA
jgi:LPXTG-motif cell wall-anchored protein